MSLISSFSGPRIITGRALPSATHTHKENVNMSNLPKFMRITQAHKHTHTHTHTHTHIHTHTHTHTAQHSTINISVERVL